jgi:hypothetical protein
MPDLTLNNIAKAEKTRGIQGIYKKPRPTSRGARKFKGPE